MRRLFAYLDLGSAFYEDGRVHGAARIWCWCVNMALAMRPPVILARKPERVVQVIKLHKKSYFGIHYPVNALQSASEAVTEASVLAFSRKTDATMVAGWLAKHHHITKFWPSRLLDEGNGLCVNAGELQPEEDDNPEDMQGLTVDEEPFTLFLQSLSLEGVALRLVTDVHADGNMATTVFKEKMEQQAIQQHFKALLAKQCNSK